MTRFYHEEDLFPREFTRWEERPWGLLFFNPDNPDSYDSNHALIFRSRTDDLPAVLAEITDFYLSRSLHPCIYQSILDDGWFGEIESDLSAAGYRSWLEAQTYMLLGPDNAICPSPDVTVRLEPVWQDVFARDIFEAAGEQWEIAVAKRQLQNPNTWFFAAWLDNRPAGMIYGHVNADHIARIDYLLVPMAHRCRGIGRALTHAFVEHCKAQHIDCALWPDGETPRRIYEEAGFRYVETRLAGRASYRK